MRVIFMGTAEFAVPSLLALLAAGHSVVGVWARVDKPSGRHYRLNACPVKQTAIDRALPVFQPTSLRRPEAAAEIAALSPSAICVAAYGLIVPPEILCLPDLGCVNVHGSVLPRYRGAAPIHRAIMAGETWTGVTTMMMNAGLDTGDILLKVEEPIGEDDTYGEVHDRLAARGAALLIQTLDLLERGECPRHVQNDGLACYAAPVTRDECRVEWSAPAQVVHNLVRGSSPRPGAFTWRSGEMLRVHRTRLSTSPAEGTPGEMQPLGKHHGPSVVCGLGSVELVMVQPAGGKPMAGCDYLLGHPIQPGERLG